MNSKLHNFFDAFQEILDEYTGKDKPGFSDQLHLVCRGLDSLDTLAKFPDCMPQFNAIADTVALAHTCIQYTPGR